MARSPVVYSPPPGTVPKVPLETIASATWNAFVNDVTLTFNTPQPVELGGTGATSLAGARANLLGVAVTTDFALARFDGVSGALQNSNAVLDDAGNMTLNYSDNGALGGPVIQLDRTSTSPAVNDFLGIVSFRGKDSGAATQVYGTVVGRIGSPVAGAEEGQLLLQVVTGGTTSTVGTVSGSGLGVTGAISATNGPGSWLGLGGATSNAANGYTKMPNGMVLQWGTVSSGGGISDLTVNFPIAFPTACRSVTANPVFNNTGPNEIALGNVSAITSSSFTFRGRYISGTLGPVPTSGLVFNWMAVGY